MNRGRVVYQIARADFLERVRRHSFLVMLAATVYLGLATAQGKVQVRLGDYAGIANSEWTGSVMALVASTFLSLVGFYVVRNSIQRDEQTRVGRVLAATPMPGPLYLAAKALSNLAVLSAALLVLVAAAIVLQFVSGKDALQLWTLISPFIFIALPALAFTAALAVLFEATPLLRGGVGNILYFFAWSVAVAAAMNWHFDPYGLAVFHDKMVAAVHVIDPAYKEGFSLTINPDLKAAEKTFFWPGFHWDLSLIAGRLSWCVVAAALAAIPSLWFARFDPARRIIRQKSERKHDRLLEPVEETAATPQVSLTPVLRLSGSRFPALIASELKLLVKGRKWWSYGISAAIIFAGFISPVNEGRFAILCIATLWPMLTLSQLGAREEMFATNAMIFSAPNPYLRQTLATWFAGSAIVIALCIGVLFRLALAGEAHGVLALIAGAFFIPALAIALGTLTGQTKFFEALYIAWWYIGPAHATSGLDFIGVTEKSANPSAYFVSALLLITTTIAARKQSGALS